MARPIWTGALTFGLVSVPVSLYSATHEHEVSFHQFEKGTADRIRYRRVNERTGDEVDYDEIVKGAEVGGGDYVMLEQEELDSVAPGRSRSLEIDRFVELDEIDPIYYQKTYYLGPSGEDTAKVYGLLRDAMADTQRAAIGTLVMRGKEYLAGIRPDGDLLVLQTMYFADEVRDPKEQIDALPRRGQAKKSEMSMAQQLIESMSGRWRPEDFRDTYTDRVNELIKAKEKGKEVTTAEPAPEPTNVTDLLEVLRQSVERAKSGRSARGSGEAPAGKAAKGNGKSAKAGSGKATTSRAKTEAKTEAKAGAKAGAGKGTTKTSRTKAGGKASTGRRRSKAELQEAARKLAVPGRSSMSRADLEKAVRQAS
nr:Ku protein [uncultured Actinoplanes sp.]